MAASVTDKFRKATSGSRPVNAYLTASKSVGTGGSISVSSTDGWATDTGIDFILFIKDTAGKEVEGTRTTWVGIVSGTTISGLVLKAGTEPAGGYPLGENSVVTATPTAAWNQSLIEGILTQHNQNGTHGSITATGYSQTTGTFSIPNNQITAANLTTSAIKLGKTVVTSPFTTTSTSPVQVTGLSVTCTIPAGGRDVELIFSSPTTSNSAGNTYNSVSIWDGAVGSGTIVGRSYAIVPNAGGFAKADVYSVITPAAGSKTYNVGFEVQSGTGSINIYPGAPMLLLVKAL